MGNVEPPAAGLWVVGGLQIGAKAEHGENGGDEKDVERLLLDASDHDGIMRRGTRSGYSSRSSSTRLSRRSGLPATSAAAAVTSTTPTPRRPSCAAGTASEVGGIVNSGVRICTKRIAMPTPTRLPRTRLTPATVPASPSTSVRTWLIFIPSARMVTYSFLRCSSSPKVKIATPAALISTVYSDSSRPKPRRFRDARLDWSRLTAVVVVSTSTGTPPERSAAARRATE